MPEHWMTSGKRRLRVKEGTSFAHRAQARAAFMGYIPNKRSRNDKGPRNIQQNHPRFYKRTAVQDLGSHWSCPIARRGIVAVGGPRRQAQTPAQEDNDMAAAAGQRGDPAAPRRRIRNANASNHFFPQNAARVPIPVPPPVQHYANPMQGVRLTRPTNGHNRQQPMHPPMPQGLSHAHQQPNYPLQASYPTDPNQSYPQTSSQSQFAETDHDFENYPPDFNHDPEGGFGDFGDGEYGTFDQAYEDSFYDYDDNSTLPSSTRMPPPSHRPANTGRLFQRKQESTGLFTNAISLDSGTPYDLEGNPNLEAADAGLGSPPWTNQSQKLPLFGNRANAFSSHQFGALAQPRQANIFPTHQSMTQQQPVFGISSQDYAAETQEYLENDKQQPIPKEIHTPFAASRSSTAKHSSLASPLSQSYASAIDGTNEADDNLLLPDLGDDEGHGGSSQAFGGHDLDNENYPPAPPILFFRSNQQVNYEDGKPICRNDGSQY